MAEINIEKMAHNVAEAALDSFEYQGKTIREWMKIIVEQTTWIPVSERLPEDSGKFLVSVIDDLTFRCGENYETVEIAWFAHKKDYGIKESEWRELRTYDTVTAWMPLPKPYEPQESEE